MLSGSLEDSDFLFLSGQIISIMRFFCILSLLIAAIVALRSILISDIIRLDWAPGSTDRTYDSFCSQPELQANVYRYQPNLDWIVSSMGNRTIHIPLFTAIDTDIYSVLLCAFFIHNNFIFQLSINNL